MSELCDPTNTTSQSLALPNSLSVEVDVRDICREQIVAVLGQAKQFVAIFAVLGVLRQSGSSLPPGFCSTDVTVNPHATAALRRPIRSADEKLSATANQKPFLLVGSALALKQLNPNQGVGSLSPLCPRGAGVISATSLRALPVRHEALLAICEGIHLEHGYLFILRTCKLVMTVQSLTIVICNQTDGRVRCAPLDNCLTKPGVGTPTLG